MELSGSRSMSDNDIFAKLRAGAKKLPQKQKLLCAYILEHYQNVAFYTVEDLARVSHTSPATVIRFVRQLGYRSFKDFLEEFQKVFVETNNSVWWELEQTLDYIDVYESSLRSVSHDGAEAIKESLTPDLLNAFNRAIPMIQEARKVGIIGFRSSKYVAGYLHYMLNQIISNVYMLSYAGTDMVYDEILNYDKRDVIIAFSLGGPHFVSMTGQVLKYAKENTIPSILIVNDMRNPAIDFATLTLCVGRVKHHYSIVQPIIVSEALVAEIGRRQHAIAKDKLQRLGQILTQENVTLP